MAGLLAGALPLSEPMLEYRKLDPGNKLKWNQNRIFFFFIRENASESDRKMAAILSCLDPNMLNTLKKKMKPWAKTSFSYMYHWIHACIANGTRWFTCGFISIYLCIFPHPPTNPCCHKTDIMLCDVNWIWMTGQKSHRGFQSQLCTCMFFVFLEYKFF